MDIGCSFQATKEKSRKLLKPSTVLCDASYYPETVRDAAFYFQSDKNDLSGQQFPSNIQFPPMTNLLQQTSAFQFRSSPSTSNNYYEANFNYKSSKYSGGFIVGAGSASGIYLGPQWTNHQPFECVELNTPPKFEGYFQNSFAGQNPQSEFVPLADYSTTSWSRHNKFYDLPFCGDSFTPTTKTSIFNIPSNPLPFVSTSCCPNYNGDFETSLEDLYRGRDLKVNSDDDKMSSPLCRQFESKICSQRVDYSGCSSEEHSRSDEFFDSRGELYCDSSKVLNNNNNNSNPKADKTSMQSDLPLYGVASIPMAIPVTSDASSLVFRAAT